MKAGDLVKMHDLNPVRTTYGVLNTYDKFGGMWWLVVHPFVSGALRPAGKRDIFLVKPDEDIPDEVAVALAKWRLSQ